MNLDPHTLLFSLMLTDVLMGLSLFATTVGRTPGDRRDGIAKWSFALFLETATWALVAGRGTIPDLFSVVAANGAKAGVHALVLAAIYEFQQRPWPRRQCLVPVALAMVMAALLVDDMRGRFIWGSLIFAVQMLLIARALLTHPESRFGHAWKLLLTGVLVALLLLALRAAFALFGHGAFAQPFSLETPHPVQMLTYVGVIATALLGSIAFVMMVKERSDREIMQLAMTDGLTQIFNRHALMQCAGQALARRDGRPLAFFMIDVDHFKRINDTHGHPAGDEVLRQVSSLLVSRLRRQDIVGRYGGEEFCVVAPDTAPEGAGILAESLREIMATTPLATERGTLAITVSIGVALCRQGSPRDLKALLADADAALYAAKQGGRNRVASFAEEIAGAA